MQYKSALGVANAISQVAQKYGTVYLNTNSSSPTAGKNCHRQVRLGRKRRQLRPGRGEERDRAYEKWMLMTNDSCHNTSAASTLAEQRRRDRRRDQGTRDFSAMLLKVQQATPQVVAAAVGGDDQKAMRQQVAQLGLGEGMAWINNQQDWPDVYGLPLDNLFGVFGTTWYWKLDLPGVPEFVQRYQAAYPDTKMRVPGNVFYNGYMATRELLGAVERAGSTNNGKVIQELEGLKVSAGDRMQHHDAYMNPATHQMQQTIYLATANQGTQDPDDMFKVLSESGPEEIRDTAADAACKMESLDDTPTYEM